MRRWPARIAGPAARSLGAEQRVAASSGSLTRSTARGGSRRSADPGAELEASPRALCRITTTEVSSGAHAKSRL